MANPPTFPARTVNSTETEHLADHQSIHNYIGDDGGGKNNIEVGHLTNVDLTGLAVGDILLWDGTNWKRIATGALNGTTSNPGVPLPESISENDSGHLEHQEELHKLYNLLAFPS